MDYFLLNSESWDDNMIIAIDKEEMFEYIYNSLTEENIIIREYVLEMIVEQALEYFSISLENQC